MSAHFHPGPVLQLGSASILQVGCQISTGRPRLKHNHRQEGIPPSWSVDPSVCARQITSSYEFKKAFAWRKWGCSLPAFPLPDSAHVIACSTAECCAWGSCRVYHKSSPPLRKSKPEPLLPPSPRNETRSTLEWSTQPTQSEHHRSHWIHPRGLWKVCAPRVQIKHTTV